MQSVCEESRLLGVFLLCRLNERKRSINTNVRTAGVSSVLLCSLYIHNISYIERCDDFIYSSCSPPVNSLEDSSLVCTTDETFVASSSV